MASFRRRKGISIMNRLFAGFAAALLLSACGGDNDGSVVTPTPTPTPAPTPTPTPAAYSAVRVADGTYAAIRFLPDGRSLFATRAGAFLVGTTAAPETGVAVQGSVPAFQIAGSGIVDVLVDSDFSSTQTIYVSTIEGSNAQGANLAIYRARLTQAGITDVAPIWRSPAQPAVSTLGRFGGFMAFRDGFIHMAVGDFTIPQAAQDPISPYGKIIRIQRDGSAAPGNPLYNGGGNPDIYTLGHRDPQGLTVGADGRMYETELGPRVGDEVNVVEFNRNYGWPIVSEGLREDETPYPRHSTRPEFLAPVFSWSTVTGVSQIAEVRSDRDGLKGELLIASTGNQAIMRLARDGNGNGYVERERISVGSPTKTVTEAPDGRIYATTYDVVDGRVYHVERR
jgi:glucose/arabinose dehydrogenase